MSRPLSVSLACIFLRNFYQIHTTARVQKELFLHSVSLFAFFSHCQDFHSCCWNIHSHKLKKLRKTTYYIQFLVICSTVDETFELTISKYWLLTGSLISPPKSNFMRVSPDSSSDPSLFHLRPCWRAGWDVSPEMTRCQGQGCSSPSAPPPTLP